MKYEYAPFPYTPPAGLRTPEPCKPVVIVGAGPIGLAMAIDLALQGVCSVVLDDNNVVSVGSRAICWAKRSLEIFDRLGVGTRMLDKGVTWKVGRTRHGDKEVFAFDLLPESGHKMPAFINLQQYYVEQYLVERAQEFPDFIDLRFKNRVTGVFQSSTAARVAIQTSDGAYELEAEYVLACDGANSTIRNLLKLDFGGELFEERFLIADIEMEADFPSERWFWFEPTFHSGQSALLHKQPDNIYRIDLQLGWDADPDEEKKPDNVIPRIRKIVGDRSFTLDWVSVYTFQCRRLDRFVHDRVLFVGDSAHVVSPFGARGGNGGIQDVDNLGWKLGLVLAGADPQILETYNQERVAAADENIRHSSQATRFMSPEPGAERIFRDAVLNLAGQAEFARSWVNSGRLSTPCVYDIDGADDAGLPAISRPGSVAPDAPTDQGWLSELLGGGFSVLAINCDVDASCGGSIVNLNATEEIKSRYLGPQGRAVYLVRPDQHVAARWTDVDSSTISQAILAFRSGIAA